MYRSGKNRRQKYYIITSRFHALLLTLRIDLPSDAQGAGVSIVPFRYSDGVIRFGFKKHDDRYDEGMIGVASFTVAPNQAKYTESWPVFLERDAVLTTI